MAEIVYILINESMPGYVKIGKTDNLEQRIRSLDTTSVPLPFECFYASRVRDAGFVESQLHEAFADQRVRSNREFFEMAPERAVAALRLAEIENVTLNRDIVETQEDQQALNKAKQRRAVFNFEMVGIPKGAELVFVSDDNIKGRVVDSRNIEFEGEVTSPSAAAQKIRGTEYPLQGTIYWLYEGETLDERRRRMEGAEGLPGDLKFG